MSQRVKCRFCGAPAITRVRYAKLSLCSTHFKEFIEKKVSRTLLRYSMVKKGSRILVAVSGGKDSVAMLHILHSLSKTMKFEVIAIHIDLGIDRYSETSLKVFLDIVSRLRVKSVVLRLKDLLGASVPELAKRSGRPICSVCGIVKRYLLNAVGVELKVDAVATGHNADDVITYIFKSFINQDFESLQKLGPVNQGIDGLAVARIKPLYEVYEREALIYVLASSIPFVEEVCPYAPSHTIDKEIKRWIAVLEDVAPGFKISFLRRFVQNIEKYVVLSGKSEEVLKCQNCGLISSSDICSFCRLTQRVLGRPMGMEVRMKIRDIIRIDTYTQ